MEVYLVGGAVRDELLGLPVEEQDWCIVGATPAELEALGYRPVGKDFPVFLHPDTQEEYALARTERKTSSGYHGFTFNTSAEVTIEEDLKRRDLTINAIAKNIDGELIDPYKGLDDLNNKILRHVSIAFTEDPVRILRVARFAAHFAAHRFTIADETLQLMREMVINGEPDTLAPERVWRETEKALIGENPHIFFQTLKDCGALKNTFPELDGLYGIPQPKKWHPEIDCGLHTLMVLEQAAMLSHEVDVRFAALVHDLGKATTQKDKLPHHTGHEKRSKKIIEKLSKRLPIPKAYLQLGQIAAQFHTYCHKAFELRPTTILKVLDRTDAFRRPQRFEKFLLVCEADARGRTGLENRDYPQADFLRQAFRIVQKMQVNKLHIKNLDGAAIGKKLRASRIDALRHFKTSYEPPK